MFCCPTDAQGMTVQSDAGVVSDVVLHYLPVRAKAEHLRTLLYHAGVTFEDKIYGFADGAWPAAKEAHTFTFDRLPVLTFTKGGKKFVIPEGVAIANLLSKWAGLTPADAAEAALGDAAYSAAGDVVKIDLIYNGFIKDKEANDQFLAGAVTHLKHMQELLGTRAFFGTRAPCAADFLLFFMCDSMMAYRPKLLEDMPELQAWFAKVREFPAVAKYLGVRSDIAAAAF
ncbi:unnamed protein product [Polarella glacialis]|uniref:Glutathione transferase n=1 Tax=Polarella glacialis TaxID=89957 RepID=A0A813G3R4_POLGL|nr:unnamed protein product [Polarella glacialis]